MREPAQPDHAVDRRAFLKGAAVGAAGLAIPVGAKAHAQANLSRSDNAPARNVILLVGDGMDMGALSIAQMYCERKLGRNLHWLDRLASGTARRSLLATTPAGNVITDSAAAATSWSIGERVNNGAISVTPDGRSPVPMLVRARAAGMATGTMTNTSVIDATPAAMYANAESRSNADSIAAQLLDAELDVVVGGGGARFTDERIGSCAGLRVARDIASLREAFASPGRVLGLLADGDLPFEAERPDGFPGFAELTSMTLQRMANLDRPFAFVVESEHIDTSTHRNDAATMMREVVAWDEALKVCLDFCDAQGDTLLVALSDHANCAPAFARYGDAAEEQFEALCNAPHSFGWFMQEYRARGGEPDAVDLVALTRETTGVTITPEQAVVVHRWLSRQPVDPFSDRNEYYCPLGSVMSNYFGVAFATYYHTTSFVEAFSIGPGSENMPHVGHQTDVHHAITKAIGLA